MYEKTVIVAKFNSATEAHLAQGLLEAKSIQGIIREKTSIRPISRS